MLKRLHIHNIILVEKATIEFEDGFNVLSGETGSGKSAILEALRLLLGDRADAGIIRRGCEKGSVEATFDVNTQSKVITLLDQAGIELEASGDLIIRREITHSGKSRALINHQMAQLSLLKKVGACLIDTMGQYASQRLLNLENHRGMLDLYADLETDLAAFSRSWLHEGAIKKEIEDLMNSESQRLRDIEVCKRELEELEEANLKEGEEEDLFAEFTILNHADELSHQVGDIVMTLSGDRQGVLQSLKRQVLHFDNIIKLDAGLTETAASFQNAFLELQEIAYSLDRYLARIERNPQRLTFLNDRLSVLHKLKRKYGPTTSDIHTYIKNTEVRLQYLEGADFKIDELRLQLETLSKQNDFLAAEISLKRKEAGKRLEKELVEQLRSLNMPKVDCEIEITSQRRSVHGDDRVEFYLCPNIGEHRIPIRECASGGELSRLLLALQTLLAGKGDIPTLVFDEIDSNIGGATATIVGEKLNEIGRKHQVLCITHFPQVARCAHHHLQISKREVEGRTLTYIEVLDVASRQTELARMNGKI